MVKPMARISSLVNSSEYFRRAARLWTRWTISAAAWRETSITVTPAPETGTGSRVPSVAASSLGQLRPFDPPLVLPWRWF